MSRPKLLLSTVALLALTWVGLWVHSWWGTITLHYENQPLATVLRSFTRQSGLRVITDMETTRLVSIHVVRVPVAEALDSLQAVTESRGGRLACLLAPEQSSLRQIEQMLPRPARDAPVLSIDYRIPFAAAALVENIPQWRDPRDQTWRPDPSLPKQLQPVLQSLAQATDVRLLLNKEWNPTLQRTPDHGALASVVPQLAKFAGGVSEIVYLLPSPRSGEGERPPGESGASPPGRWDGGGRTSTPLAADLWLKRLEPRLAALPPEEAAAARSIIQQTAKQFHDWDSQPPEERERKVQELMQDPAQAEKMSERFSRGMRQMSPEQRSQRYQRYVERRASAKSGHP